MLLRQFKPVRMVCAAGAGMATEKPVVVVVAIC